ncbi:hypothetical protein LSCM1_00241 [Leishmania martiniquensis]|uniref:Endonuclease V n=1 Tax=Leishmania martiniquensis TaxID=1580590 RepID=A0A836K8L1_9TRYP|nr:hypothetical protein LSCM1_00241 [Leishmania martiniquensis]
MDRQQHLASKDAANAAERCEEAHVPAALPLVALRQLIERKSEWEEAQRRTALVADVPQAEYYYRHCTSGQGSAEVQANAAHNGGAAPDEGFVHRHFALPDFEASFLAMAQTGAGGSTKARGVGSARSDSSSLESPWEALRHQLRLDKARQSAAAASTYAVAPQLPALTLVGGVDISFIPGTDDGVACLAILRYPSMRHVKAYVHRCTLRVPYISGFLAFREMQPIVELFSCFREELLATRTMPQLLLVDGNGVQHPRRCGLATHLGVVLDIPAIGCSKKMLQVDGLTREAIEAALQTLIDAESNGFPLPRLLPLVGTSLPRQLYGYAVQGRLNSVKKCIYVSPGHCVGFAVATALVVTMQRHRIPEPIRIADLSSRAYISNTLASGAVTITHSRRHAPT